MNKIDVILKINIKLIILIWNRFGAKNCTLQTALSGTMGLFQTTGDEVAYLVDAKGYKISAINPREKVTIAFGCNGDKWRKVNVFFYN